MLPAPWLEPSLDETEIVYAFMSKAVKFILATIDNEPTNSPRDQKSATLPQTEPFNRSG
jgi:hypothetical protein